MARYLGKTWTREELRSVVGDVAQVAGARPSVLADGKADGVRAVEVYTGSGLRLHRAPGARHGHPLRQLQGHVALVPLGHGHHPPRLLRGAGTGWLRGFYAGLLTTCGICSAGAPSTDQGRPFGLHGRYSNAAAEDLCVRQGWEGDEYLHPALGHGARSVGDERAPGAHPHLRDPARRPRIPPARRGGEPRFRGAAPDAALPLQLRLPPARARARASWPRSGLRPPATRRRARTGASRSAARSASRSPATRRRSSSTTSPPTRRDARSWRW